MAKGTTEKQCIQCGRTFRAGSNLTCNPCRTTGRECATCGKTFRGRERDCYECRATDHPCAVCGGLFHGVKRTCERCRKQRNGCQMPGCAEPKLRGRGHHYCPQHYAEGRQRENAQVVRRKREREYGLTHDQYLALLEAQDGTCAICGNDSQQRALAVDHDHETGAIRGLLCDRCNPMLGYARDNTEVLQAAIEYLKQYQVPIPPQEV
jgi:hypothetical protein